ncbi:hypothetical protein [Henriciella litoralis]|uniref:hypothetical protein n=1 Tax=Henriciella litoralis TaxID=568102 RepID=UPI0009FEF416|nr:hypothetical protein [Henriciella litoralis]
MLRLLSLPVLAAAFALPSYGELLSANEIILAIEGRWALAYEDDPDPENRFRCDDLAIHIQIDEIDGDLVYRSQHEGQEAYDTSPVLTDVLNNGQTAPWIRLHYESEDRLTEEGEPVEWRLIMPDENTFFWARTDWEWGFTTKPRRRCLTQAPGM